MQGGIRPNTAKPKDPSELNIEDEELAKDYRKMYERFTEMEAKMASLLQKDEQEKDIPDDETHTLIPPKNQSRRDSKI